ncbi:MAG: DUF362 domain-containing protein [Bacteroidetes bacterium]|nr:DUF362 domain-containing protein [Bacteroidota bacterium]
MYNPIPHLPEKYQRFIAYLKARKMPPGLIFFVLGSLATLRFLIRVIPKPSRAAYPCMQATAPFMSGFVLYLIIAGLFYALSHFSMPELSFAGKNSPVRGYFTPNAPIGEAKGIFPGRVVWMWDPHATNELCSNTSNNNGVIDPGDDAWFMNQNNDQQAIDSMLIRSVIALTGASGNTEAWDLIFKFYNNNHGNGNVGYSSGQKIFIKINATTANSGVAGGHYHADLSRTDNLAVNAFASETNPFVVLSMLRQLVNVAQVPENMIYIGDPARNIYKEFYDLWHGEFPNVHYLGNDLLHPELNIVSLGRTPVEVTSTDKVFFSDHGAVMSDAISDKLFTIFEEVDYLINIPAMKAHSAAGITLAAKNHFGSFTRTWALQLHPGMFGGTDDPQRLGYGLYRVQTDIMMHKLLSGKNLLIVIDALYPSDDAGAVPFKWTSIPFGNDWCSSIFMSLDPVALESVCHDFLRTEYNGPTIAESRPNWFGVDDYLHQAADSSLWPENIVYDPDNDGNLFASLGVHEHWNDSLHKQYTRNLETGNGIELFKVHDLATGVAEEMKRLNISAYPNPASSHLSISNPGNNPTYFTLSNVHGKLLMRGLIKGHSVNQVDLTRFENGIYIIQLNSSERTQDIKIIKQ